MTPNSVKFPTYNSNAGNDGSNDEIDLGKLISEVIDKKWVILFVTLVFGFFGIVYGQLATPIYKSDALIQVENNAGGVLALDYLDDVFAVESSAATEIYILKSRFVLGKTVDDLNLSVKIEANYFPILGVFFARRHKDSGLAEPMFGSAYAWGGEQVVVSAFTVSKVLLSKEFVLVAEGDQQYSLWFQDEKLLSGVVGSFASNDQYAINIKLEHLTANVGTRFSLKKYSRLKTIMNLQAEFKAVSLGKDTGIMQLSLFGTGREDISAILNSISANYVTQNVQRLAAEAENSLNFINHQIPKIKASLNKAEIALNTYRAARESVDLSLETQSLLESFVKIEADISAMALNEADISRRFTIEHPNYRSFNRQQANLFAQRDRLNKKIGGLPETQQKILTLMRDFEVNQAIYLSLQNKSQELAIVRASAVGNVRVLDSAEVLPGQYSPRKGLMFALSVLLGGFISTFFVLIRSVLNSGISSPQEFQNIGLNVYATIPISDVQCEFDRKNEVLKKRHDLSSESELLLASKYSEDRSIEAIRSLRTSLHFGMLETKNNIVMISSGNASVGKSFVGANLCAVLAQSDKRVLLIDADLRRGYLHKRFDFDLGVGLSDFLLGSNSVEDMTRKTSIDNLDFVSRGLAPPNPSELLMTRKFKDYLEQVSGSYDLVVIDTPPILAVTDAAIVGQHAGISLMVVRFRETSLQSVISAEERFRINGIDIKGVIFNAVDVKFSRYYGAYNYYDYSYESDTSKY